MLTVPWFLGWALRPYIEIHGSNTAVPTPADDSASAVARAQVAKISSAPPAGKTQASPTSSKPYPVAIQPVTTKRDNQVKPQTEQQITVSRTTAVKAEATSPALRRAQPEKPDPGPAKQVSTASISLKMSAQWAQRQLEQFKFSFDEADTDKSGFLSVDEVYNVLAKNGFKGSKDEAKKLFALLDMNKDQKWSRDEFMSAINKLPRLTIKEFVLRKAFNQLDKDGNGTLTRAEIEAATKKEAGLDIALEKINQLLDFLQKESKDNVIDYEEFLRVFGVQATATVMHQVFSKLDADNSGFLTKEEIMKALDSEFELKLRAAKISDLLIAWHKDADKKLNYNEFVQEWIKYK